MRGYVVSAIVLTPKILPSRSLRTHLIHGVLESSGRSSSVRKTHTPDAVEEKP